MTRPLPPRPNLQQLKHQAKDLRKERDAGDAAAIARVREHLPRCAEATDEQIRNGNFSLQEAQHVIACEYGFKHWEMLSAVVEVDIDVLGNLSDREAQQLMREIDQKDMTAALIGAAPALQSRFLLNMSARVRGFIRAEMEMSKAGRAHTMEARRRIVLQAAHFVQQGAIQWPDRTAAAPSERIDSQYQPSGRLRQIGGRPLDQLSSGDLEDLWTGLSAQVHTEGILSLNEYADSVDDPFLRTALLLAVDETESDLAYEMLETRMNYAVLPDLRTRGMMALEGTMAIYSGDNAVKVRRKLAMFVAQPSPTWDDLDIDELTVESLVTQLREKSVAEMTLENLADFYAHMASIARDLTPSDRMAGAPDFDIRMEGIRALKPLCKELSKKRDLTTELVRRGLELICDEIAADQVMKTMEAQLEVHLDGSEKAHRMVIEGVRAIQESKSTEEVASIVRAVRQ